MKNNKYKFTVCTTTYNRADLLPRLYDSLRRQSFIDFEWIIIDDGSTDNTENIIATWVLDQKIKIKYFKQENSGKHIALNKALDYADGELFFIVDSDDYLPDNAIQIFNETWDSILNKESFCAVFANCVDIKGNLVGTPFPSDSYDSNFYNIFYKDDVRGDKCGVFLTSILKNNKFPNIGNEKFIPEALVWNRLSLNYKIKFINKNLVIVDYQSTGLSAQSVKIRVKNPQGTVLYYKEFLFLPVPLFWKLRNLINYIRFSLHAKLNFFKQINNLKNKSFALLLILFYPLGLFFYILDLKKVQL